MFYPKITAKSGNLYLAEIDIDLCRIIDTEKKIVGIRLDKIQALMSGNWEDCDHDQSIIDACKQYKWLKIP